MKTVETNIVSVAENKGQLVNTFTVLLGEMTDSNMRYIPIYIKSAEAAFIVNTMNGRKPTMPQSYHIIHELMVNTNTSINEICIYRLIEGIFYTKVVFQSENRNFDIEVSVGDAICISCMNMIPVKIAREIMDKISFVMDTTTGQAIPSNPSNPNEVVSLETKLKIAIENEDYIEAAKIRNEINNRNANNPE